MSGAGDLIYSGNNWDVANNPTSLDDSEGTFTPTIIGTSAAGTAGYSNQEGYYKKQGDLVYVQVYLNYNSGTGTGNLRIAGLPFTSDASSASGFGNLTVGYISNIALTAGNWLTAYVASSSTQIALAQNPTGGGAAANVPYDAAGEILLSGWYKIV